jgi:hypothetical protein
MLNLALWLKKNNFHLDQVQTFTPTPMAMATTMYHTRKNPLHKVSEDSEVVETARSGKVRKLHKAFLRYYDPENWPILREALKRMGRSDLIGNGERHLVPPPGGTMAEPAPQQGERARAPRVPAARPERPQPRGRAERVSVSAAPVSAATAGKVKPSILSTIKAKPKAGRK